MDIFIFKKIIRSFQMEKRFGFKYSNWNILFWMSGDFPQRFVLAHFLFLRKLITQWKALYLVKFCWSFKISNFAMPLISSKRRPKLYPFTHNKTLNAFECVFYFFLFGLFMFKGDKLIVLFRNTFCRKKLHTMYNLMMWIHKLLRKFSSCLLEILRRVLSKLLLISINNYISVICFDGFTTQRIATKVL